MISWWEGEKSIDIYHLAGRTFEKKIDIKFLGSESPIQSAGLTDIHAKVFLADPREGEGRGLTEGALAVRPPPPDLGLGVTSRITGQGHRFIQVNWNILVDPNKLWFICGR